MSDSEQKNEQAANAPVAGLGEDKINGVFSTQSVSKVGTGTTQRKTIQKTYWFVDENDDGTVDIQPLNVNYVPSGPKRQIPKEDFLAKFNPEPEFYFSTVFPNIRKLDDALVRGEKHRARGANYSAELEFKRAADVDEGNVRANFGLGLTYLARGEYIKANDIFERLVKLDAAFDQEHKHLFNDFGINLRKNRMFDQALAYYVRAEELVDNDENLYHNIARVYYEKGNLEECVRYLKKALQLNPNHTESLRFWNFIKGKGLLSDVNIEDVPASAKAGDEPSADKEPAEQNAKDLELG